jgi:hypothetical protein
MTATERLVVSDGAGHLRLSVPDDADIQCEAGDTCPDGLVCATRAKRCVDPKLVNAETIDVTVEPPARTPVLSEQPPFDVLDVVFVASRRPQPSSANRPIPSMP